MHPGAVPLEYKEGGLKILETSKIPKTIKDSLKSESGSEAEVNENRIADFESFVNYFDSGSSKKLRKDWNIYEQPDGICFYRLTRDEFFYNIQISFKILVNRDMRVLLFRCVNEADPKELDWILRDSKLETRTQLHKLLEHYRSEPMIMEKSNSTRIIKQALELLKNITKSPEVEKRIDSIIKLLVETLDQIEPIMSFASVKLEPEEYTVEFYAGQEFKDENTIDEILNEHKLEVELENNEETNIENNNKFETSLSKVVVKTKATKDPSMPNPVLKKRQNVTQKEKKVKTEFLLDCQLCDRKQMTKDQLRYHGYSKHVRFFKLTLFKFSNCK